jgi:hypothetical protein
MTISNFLLQWRVIASQGLNLLFLWCKWSISNRRIIWLAKAIPLAKPRKMRLQQPHYPAHQAIPLAKNHPSVAIFGEAPSLAKLCEKVDGDRAPLADRIRGRVGRQGGGDCRQEGTPPREGEGIGSEKGGDEVGMGTIRRKGSGKEVMTCGTHVSVWVEESYR